MDEEMNDTAQAAWEQGRVKALEERVAILEHVLLRLVQLHPELFPAATEQVYAHGWR